MMSPVILNQFINVAVTEKLAHRQREEWLAHRPKATDALIHKALDILDRSTGHTPEEFDRIPAGYGSIRRKSVAKRAAGRG